MKKIFVFGSLNMDFIFSLNRLPKQGETILSDDYQTSPGGKGANQAVACAKQGVETIMLGSIGADSFSDTIKQSLSQYNVQTSYLQVVDNTSTGVACIWVKDGDNQIVVYPGANHHHQMKHIESVLKTQANPGDLLLMQMEIPMQVIEKTVELAKSLDLEVVLNLAPYGALSSGVLSQIDLLIVNQLEAEALLSKALDGPMEVLMKDILSLGPKRIILTQGKKGSFYYDGLNYYHTPAYLVDTVDTTGAGDAYIGAFVASQLSGVSIENSLKRASACASLTIQKVAVHQAIPTDNMITEFLEEKE
jgi:ribokinase